jgi:hypothetical protein
MLCDAQLFSRKEEIHPDGHKRFLPVLQKKIKDTRTNWQHGHHFWDKK